ncbi:hypothetical protein JJB99_12215 [Bradyrhizobium diazoefficiens]|uniref:hypothetical protein n=1 Tax=Bradyrhizobium diazoefficiens TaxID=1355477 RepID=UPI00190AB054|nr:hypothetical protein [Bradyrhizobium diazoefficiens]QQO16849.1 hypothetical protein JJB99_12215 [Bradyrhizobium diazoefficiens]
MKTQLRSWLTFSLIVTSLFFSFNRAVAQNALVTGDAARSFDSELDSFFKAKDWGHLTAALEHPPSDATSLSKGLVWLKSRVDGGGGFLLTLHYMRWLWMIGISKQISDPAADPRMSAALLWLYAFELAAIDGAKCEDKTAPSHRVDQLIEKNGVILAFMKSQSTEWKEKIVALALGYETRTAPARQDDDLLCRGGLHEIRAGLARGTQQEVSDKQGYPGKSVEVTGPPDYTPRFLPGEVYGSAQVETRRTMREKLLKLIQ